MLVEVIKDGQKNFSILVKGFVKADFEPTPILDLSKLQAPMTGWKGIRLDSAVWAIQEKMTLKLWWNKPEGEADLVFPLESRNAMRFDEGIPSPRMEKNWRGIMYLSGSGVKDGGLLTKCFMVLLDFDKQ